jgi:hypothetical protein
VRCARLGVFEQLFSEVIPLTNTRFLLLTPQALGRLADLAEIVAVAFSCDCERLVAGPPREDAGLCRTATKVVGSQNYFEVGQSAVCTSYAIQEWR